MNFFDERHILSRDEFFAFCEKTRIREGEQSSLLNVRFPLRRRADLRC
jgi:hypothetical protein